MQVLQQTALIRLYITKYTLRSRRSGQVINVESSSSQLVCSTEFEWPRKEGVHGRNRLPGPGITLNITCSIHEAWHCAAELSDRIGILELAGYYPISFPASRSRVTSNTCPIHDKCVPIYTGDECPRTALTSWRIASQSVFRRASSDDLKRWSNCHLLRICAEPH